VIRPRVSAKAEVQPTATPCSVRSGGYWIPAFTPSASNARKYLRR
jgi:hypothetical protein